MAENRSSLFGIIAIIIGASGLGVGAYSIVSFQLVKGPQGLPGEDGQDAPGGILIAILDPDHGEIVTGKKTIRTLVTGSESYTISILRNGTEIGTSLQLEWDTSTISDGWWNITVIVTDVLTSDTSSDEVIVHVKNFLIEYPCSSEVEIRDALDAIETGYGVITILNDITISEQFVINGSGNYIIQGINSIISLGGEINVFMITNATSCTIQNLRINASALIISNTRMIYITEIHNNPVYIENVHIIGDSDKMGIGLYVLSENVWVSNCYLNQLQIGISINANRAHIRDNTISNCSSVGVAMTVTDLNVIVGNIIEDTHYGIVVYYSRYNTITSNLIRNCDQGIRILDSSFNTIGNNELIQTQVGIWIDAGLITEGNLIIGNVIYTGSFGIWLQWDASGPYCWHYAIVSNIISYCSVVGIRIENANGTTVVGNTLFQNGANLSDFGLNTYISGNNMV